MATNAEDLKLYRLGELGDAAKVDQSVAALTDLLEDQYAVPLEAALEDQYNGEVLPDKIRGRLEFYYFCRAAET